MDGNFGVWIPKEIWLNPHLRPHIEEIVNHFYFKSEISSGAWARLYNFGYAKLDNSDYELTTKFKRLWKGKENEID